MIKGHAKKYGYCDEFPVLERQEMEKRVRENMDVVKEQLHPRYWEKLVESLYLMRNYYAMKITVLELNYEADKETAKTVCRQCKDIQEFKNGLIRKNNVDSGR